MNMDREIHRGTEPPENREEAEDLTASLIDMMMRDLRVDLEDLEGPSAEELAALDQLEDPTDDDLAALDDLGPMPLSLDLAPSAAIPTAAPAAESEPEIVSLERLDDADVDADLDEEPADDDDFLDELLDDYIDIELEDDELDDEGYDLDDEEFDNYHDLYGEDDSIIPSFREGEALDEDDDDGDVAFYDDLR
jgi:hypothetical protein